MKTQEVLEPIDPSANTSSGKALWSWRWFWRVTLVVSLGITWYCFYVPNNNIAWANDFNDAQLQATQSGKPMILYFTGKWCVPCRIMKREVWADEQVSATVNAQFIPVAIQVDSPSDVDVSTRYNVSGSPVTIITDPQGNAG
jgi:protein disulfide-isomerase